MSIFINSIIDEITITDVSDNLSVIIAGDSSDISVLSNVPQVNTTNKGDSLLISISNGFLDVPSNYNLLKGYENEFGYSSKDMLNKWKIGSLQRNSKTNNWLMTYLKIKDFIYE